MDKLEVRMIMEIMGRPPGHIVDTLKIVLDKLGKERGVLIKDVKIREPVKVKDAKNLYTSFAEVEAEFESVATYLGIIFAYLPSNAEIISPQKIVLSNDVLNSLGSNLINRMHTYDAIAKKMLVDKENLVRQAAALQDKTKSVKKSKAKKKTKA